MRMNGKRKPAFENSSSLLLSAVLLSGISLFSIANSLSSETSNITWPILAPEVNSSHLSTGPLHQKTNFSYSANSQFHLRDSETRNQRDTTVTLHISDGESTASQSIEACKLKAIDASISDKILSKFSKDIINLLEYQLTFPNYSVNPLSAISLNSYRLDSWARASSRHGQALLSFLFNYGIFSLRTLTFGTDFLVVEMQDVPDGCASALNETQMVAQLLFLLSRDFKDAADEVLLKGDERICHEIIVDTDGYAKFTDQCFQKGPNGELVETLVGNIWINCLYVMLTIVRFGVLLFGPLLLTSAVARMSKKDIRYVVELKDPLRKTVCLTSDRTEATRDSANSKNNYKLLVLRTEQDFPKFRESIETILRKELKTNSTNYKLLDVRTVQSFSNFRESIETLPREKELKVQISRYDIMVDYRKLLTENRVPVSLWRSLARMIFLCKIRKVRPFKRCCKSKVLKSCPCKCKSSTPWSYVWRTVGMILLVICIPTPWYFRLWVFYAHEYDEVLSRKEATAKVGLMEGFDNSLIYYFTPDHWLFRGIYVLYIVSAVTLAYVARRGDDWGLRRIITGSFSDLESLSWIWVLEMLVDIVIWPFERYGLCGLLVACVYWPLFVPLSLIVFILYILPLTYLVGRMVFYSSQMSINKRKTEEIGQYISFHSSTVEDSKRQDDLRGKYKVRNGDHDVRFMKAMSMRSLASALCILSLISYLIILSECIGCIVEVIVFTLMGIIVNAGTLLKYVSIVILVVVYSYDSFNNVEKKYLKLNKAIFGEVKKRIKDLEEVTGLPSRLQKNRGFKSQELNQQGEHESPDDLEAKPGQAKPGHPRLMINDLVLFVDNEDTPRIPKKLFKKVCQIQVAGVPGPIYSGVLIAVRQFLKIALFITFVFVVVLSFADIYKISSTNQMLATLAVGFLPVILRQFMEPEKPDIEIGTVSFSSKLDEIIKNFKQPWPIHDFSLKEATDDQNKAPQKEKKSADDENCNKTATEQTVLFHGVAETEITINISQRNANRTTTKKVTSDVSSTTKWFINCPPEKNPEHIATYEYKSLSV